MFSLVLVRKPLIRNRDDFPYFITFVCLRIFRQEVNTTYTQVDEYSSDPGRVTGGFLSFTCWTFLKLYLSILGSKPSRKSGGSDYGTKCLLLGLWLSTLLRLFPNSKFIVYKQGTYSRWLIYLLISIPSPFSRLFTPDGLVNIVFTHEPRLNKGFIVVTLTRRRPDVYVRGLRPY